MDSCPLELMKVGVLPLLAELRPKLLKRSDYILFHVYKRKTDLWLDDASPTGRQVWETWARF